MAVELLTGTFYLLMLGAGMVAGAIAAHAGASTSTQLVTAALVGGGAVAAWHVVRRRQHAADPAAGTNLDFDAGERVQVEAWSADNTSQVRYRGAIWTAIPAGGTPQGTGPHRVRQVDGSRLVLEKI